MNSKHLAKGSQCPPPPVDKLRIYNMRFCPYAQRSVLVAIAKNIPHEIINCNLVDKPEWLFTKNPGGKVPVLEEPDGKILYESLIVSDYLDEVYPNRPLHAKCPYQKALDKLMIEEFNKVTTLFYKALTNLKPEGSAALKDSLVEFQKGLSPFEKELEKRGTTFFGGNDAPGMLDYMIWPWIERVPVMKLSTDPDIFDFETAKKDNPNLESWRNAMKEDDAVKQYYLSAENHLKFIKSFLVGKADYDFLVQ
ncbi:pyrimidodiazepine synthase [Folsomia candida]|uniref:pyrimidodiazepine synthase n=1 Tax=Folsomia candida TaxID=158441 RepID=UPI000B907258|nr:pyrimidodiazepine synthase [Folsomia candida]XP_035701795.1 pyrimidodiazepine synthase [Folsomia candida]